MAEKYGGDNVLVVLDIDNTLLTMGQDLGSDSWYYWQKSLAEDEPCSNQRVGDLLTAQGALYFASAMQPVQEDAAVQVRRMQDANLRVVALSARSPEYRLATFRELRRNGFSFWPSAWPPARGYAEPFVPAGGERPVLYEDGVFLTAGQNKGAMLKALLDKSGQALPQVIIAVDDKQSNLNDMMSAFSWSGTVVQAWHYTRSDQVTATFDAQQAAAEWDALKPALLQIEQLLGRDNIDLPASVVLEGCETP